MSPFPNAVRRLGHAAMEARAQRTRQVMQAQGGITADAALDLLERVSRGELSAEQALRRLEDRP
jgi:hypothetical protein